MKLFALSAVLPFTLGTTTEATILETTPVNDLSNCFGNAQKTFIESKIDAVNGDDASKRDNYRVVYKNINNGGSSFVTVTCRFAPWQHNDVPTDPYNATAGRIWDKSEAHKYQPYKADRVALKKWILRHGGTEKWPGGAGGRFRCGYRKEDHGSVLAWRQLKAIPVCPQYDEVNETVEYVDTVRVQERLNKNGSHLCGSTNCLSISLVWDNDGTPFDLDLIVTTPSGKILDYSQKKADGGSLDLDMGGLATDPVENVIFEENPPQGTYKIQVHAYSGSGQKDYSVRVQKPGNNTHPVTSNGKIGAKELVQVDTFVL